MTNRKPQPRNEVRDADEHAPEIYQNTGQDEMEDRALQERIKYAVSEQDIC